jgi:hypothetical protein
LFHRVSQAVQRSNSRIAAPGKNQLRSAARADELIVDQVGRHADERQVPAALPDNFVACREWNQVCEALQSHHITVANHFLDRLLEWKNVRQTVIMARSPAAMRFCAMVLIAPALVAHHSTGDYDLTRPASVTGVVTRFEWANPHAHVFLDATNADGSVEHWVIELDSPNALQRMGWSKDSLKAGDQISCSGARARDGSPRMRCTQVVMAGGRALHSF